MKERNDCLNCIYLSRRPGMGAYFIWTCHYWGLVSKKILPQYIVASSIGKKCPFFKQKIIKKDKPQNINSNNNEIDIII